MKRRAVLLSVALAASILGAAHARTAHRGGNLHVVREPLFTARQLFLAFSAYGDSDTSVQLLGFQEPAVGTKFSVVDAEGYVGEVRVERVSPGPACNGMFQVESKLLAPPARRDAQTHDTVAFALGQLLQSYPHARAMRREHLTSTAHLPRSPVSLMGGVDLDDDGLLDVAAYIFDCDQGPDQPPTFRTDACVEAWFRAGERWEVETGRFSDCH